MKFFNYAALLCAVFFAAQVTSARRSASSVYERVAQRMLDREMDDGIVESQADNSDSKSRVRRAKLLKYPYGEGRPTGEDGQIRMIALNNAVQRREILGTPRADQVCREAAIKAGLDTNIWRAAIASKIRSLNAVLIYESERKNAKIVNRDGAPLFDSWLDFLNGRERAENPILSFNGTNLEDLQTEYAWFGYLDGTRGNEAVTADTVRPYCGNWLLMSGYGPALDVNGFVEGRSVQENIRNIPCDSEALILCIEARVQAGRAYSPFGIAKVQRRRVKAWGDRRRNRYTQRPAAPTRRTTSASQRFTRKP